MDELTVEGLIEWHEEQCGHMRDTLDDIEVHWIAKRAATERLAFHTNAVELLKKQKELCGVSAQSETGVASQLLVGDADPAEFERLVQAWRVIHDAQLKDEKR